jgi:hypothetical protein
VANLIGGDHFHSQFTKYGLHERRGIGIALGRSGGQKSRYKAEKGYRSITQRGWLSQQVEMIEIVGSNSYGTH